MTFSSTFTLCLVTALLAGHSLVTTGESLKEEVENKVHKMHLGQFFVTSDMAGNCTELAEKGATLLEGSVYHNLDAFDHFKNGDAVMMCRRWRENYEWHRRNGTVRMMFIETHTMHHMSNMSMMHNLTSMVEGAKSMVEGKKEKK